VDIRVHIELVIVALVPQHVMGAGKELTAPVACDDGHAFMFHNSVRQHNPRTSYSLSPNPGSYGLAQRTHRREHSARLVSAVGHAIVAAGVLPAPELVPLGGVEQFLPGLRISVIE
jgi:hypothetical protein